MPKFESQEGYLVLESGEIFCGQLFGDFERAGEVVFNTSHSGYEEMGTDPSYFGQILVATAPMQGNYGVDREVWESGGIKISGFVSLEIQNTERESGWLTRLLENQVPVVTGFDTRRLVLHLREKGTTWGAIVKAENSKMASSQGRQMIREGKSLPQDWMVQVSAPGRTSFTGNIPKGPRVALIDFGCKSNIRRIIERSSSEVALFNCKTSAVEIQAWEPDGIILSSGPGDPTQVSNDVLGELRTLLGWRPIFGICMGHQVLCRVAGGRTFKLKFGHRGGNHPVKDQRTGEIYVTSQNHGYAVEPDSLPKEIVVTHTNLNDQTVEGVEWSARKCWGIQFHPESHPGPRDAEKLLVEFLERLR